MCACARAKTQKARHGGRLKHFGSNGNVLVRREAANIVHMMRLPEILESPQGFKAVGASPELLRELLDEFAVVSLRSGFDLDETCNPGIGRQEIIDAWAPQGITPPEEAIVWWGWHNGYRMHTTNKYPGIAQISVDQSVRGYASMPKGDGEYSWNPRWILLWHNVAMDTAPTDRAPLVRATDGGMGTYPDDTDKQVMSMCTPVTMWLTCRENGWTVFTPEKWTYDQERIPPEWWKTQLSHF